ncbi:DUF4261 domain-containing protein [Diaphorobacter aerolatus]|uniref:DUF4261 domain-containing protein n=1 Tax=Diaphorobacter aerolatus TaxID=1288495 RepID=A0A7H0GMJ1_9BURK|nr:DUF4261 domain-containing protein [Diaphorobacter aerolatus]QNP49507.1 DUF4261 domain-containing protein [Diaphorobacter aerolatus]
MNDAQTAFSHRQQPDMWNFEALYTRPPELDGETLRAALAERLGDVAIVSDGATILLALNDYCVNYADKKGVPSQIAIMQADKPLDPAHYAEAAQQTWDWPDKDAALAQCQHSVMVTELMGRGLQIEDRLEILQAIMHVVIECSDVKAISQTPARCLLNPETYLQNHADGYVYYGLFNLRFFSISNENGDMLMDSLGLSVFGVPDMQCHFWELDPTAMSRMLFNSAVYLIQNGDVVEDGHTLAGITEGSRWRCQHEDSLVAPERMVLDVNPGAPYAAGNRDS